MNWREHKEAFIRVKMLSEDDKELGPEQRALLDTGSPTSIFPGKVLEYFKGEDLCQIVVQDATGIFIFLELSPIKVRRNSLYPIGGEPIEKPFVFPFKVRLMEEQRTEILDVCLYEKADHIIIGRDALFKHIGNGVCIKRKFFKFGICESEDMLIRNQGKK